MGLARAELSNIDQAEALVLARHLLGCSERTPRRRVCPVGNGVHIAFRVPVRKTREARVDALGRDLRAGETGACSATPAGEAETPTQSGSGCCSGFCPWGGLSGDQLRCSRVQIPGGAALHCWGGRSTETASSEEVLLVVEARINLFYNGHHLHIASPMKTAPQWTWQQTSTPEQTGQRGQGRGTEGSFALQGMSCLQQGLSARQQALLPQSAPQLAAAQCTRCRGYSSMRHLNPSCCRRSSHSPQMAIL